MSKYDSLSDRDALVEAARELHLLVNEEHSYWYAGDNRKFSEKLQACNAKLAAALEALESKS